MIQLFRKSNDKAGAEVDPKDPTKQKWNADNVFVQIENEMVSLSELAKHSKENDYEAVQSVENELEIDGSVHNVSDLIAKYKAKKKNADDAQKEIKKGEEEGAKETVVKNAEEEAKKKEEEAKNKKNAEDEALKKKDEDEKMAKKNAEDEEAKKKEEEKKENEKKITEGNGKKDVQHFVRLNTARENGSVASTLTIDTMTNRVDRGRTRYGTDQ